MFSVQGQSDEHDSFSFLIHQQINQKSFHEKQLNKIVSLTQISKEGAQLFMLKNKADIIIYVIFVVRMSLVTESGAIIK